jgi:hypothetical protein
MPWIILCRLTGHENIQCKNILPRNNKTNPNSQMNVYLQTLGLIGAGTDLVMEQMMPQRSTGYLAIKMDWSVKYLLRMLINSNQILKY